MSHPQSYPRVFIPGLLAALVAGSAAMGACADDSAAGAAGPAADRPADPPAEGDDADAPTREASAVPLPRGEVLTSKNDNLRTGANLDEDVLDVESAKRLMLVATLPVDGELYAQPLVVTGVETAIGRKDLVLAATMNDSLYAFDLNATDGAPPVWHAGKDRELGVPGVSSRNVVGPHGILSTPVVDKARGLVFLVSRTCDAAQPSVTVGSCQSRLAVPPCREQLIAVDLATGAVRSTVTVEGRGQREGGTDVAFDANVQWNRPALLLEGDDLFVGFGSGPNGTQHEEDFVYHGFLFRYDVRNMGAPPTVFVTTPNGQGGSVWQAGAGPASDGTRVYFTTANRILGCSPRPPADYPATPDDHEDSVVSLPLRFPPLTSASARDAGATGADGGRDGSIDRTLQGALSYSDSRAYTAAGHAGTVFQFTNSGDVGFGTSGPTLIPGSSDMVVGSKGGIVYLLDRETMLARQEPLSVFTLLPLQGDHTLYVHSWWGVPALYGSLAFYRPDAADGGVSATGLVYGWANDDRLRSLRYDYGSHTLSLERTADVPAMHGGAFVSVSAHGGRAGTGVVWATSRSVTTDTSKGHVWALDASTLERLWDVETPAFSKFTPPTVARGRVLVPSARATGAQAVLVYGLP